MAFETKEIMVYIRRGLMFTIKTTYRSACAHPFTSSAVFFLLILYRASPSLFAFLVSSSPVIACTALLLGTLLSYGAPNIPEIEEDKKTQVISSLQVGSVVDDLVVKKDESFAVETHVETSTQGNERTVEKEALGEASTSAGNEAVRDVPFTTMHDEGYHKDDILAARSLVEGDKKEIHSEKKLTEEREVRDHGFVKKREFSVEKQAEGALELGEDVGVFIKDQKEVEGLAVQIAEPASDNLYDSSLGSPWQPIDSHNASSGSDSDGAESSSPDASMADIIPMLDELHPLLDSEHPQATLRATDNSDASSGSSQDHESDDGSAEEEVENKEDEDKEAAQEEKDDANEVVTWTADDQKNVMDLGISELERNRRLENLIAKRRARKLQRFETEKHLIDLNSYYPTLIPSISAPRRNPFDFPYDSDGNMCLPPIPSSAPSVLQPRQNPFDLPYDQLEEISSLSKEHLSHHDFASSPQRDMFSRRNESSASGSSLSGDFNQEKHDTKSKPYFVADRMDSEEIFTSFQSELSEKSESKLSSLPEYDMISSVTGQGDHKEERIEPDVHQESELFSPAYLDAEHVEQDSQSSEEVDSVGIEHEQSGMDVGDDRATDLNNSTIIEEPHQAADAFGAVAEETAEEEIGEVENNLPVPDTGKLEVIEEWYEESNSSTSEENEKSSGMSIHEESAKLEQTRDGTMQSERADAAHAADPVYDSSSSAVGKSLSSISTLDEALLYEGREGLIYSSLASDVQADFSDVVSPPRPLEANVSFEDKDFVAVSGSMGEDLASGSGGLWVEFSNLSSVGINESRSREITEIKEHNAIQVGISEVSDDFVHPVPAVMPDSTAGKIMHSSSLSSVDSESSEDHPIKLDKRLQSEVDEINNAPPSTKEFVIHPSSEAGLGESQDSILDLPSIPEEKLEDFKLEEEHESMIHRPGSTGLTGLQVIEEPKVHLSDTDQEPSLYQKSPEETGNDDDTKGLVPEAENGDASVVSPVILTHVGGFTGLHFLEPKERMEFATLPETKSELEMETNNDLSDSQGNIREKVQSKQEGGFMKNLNDLDEESDDEVRAEVTDIKEIDEGLLSELDAVGDFWVELKSDQGSSEVGLQSKDQFNNFGADSCTGMDDISSQLLVSGARPSEDADMSVGQPYAANLSNSDEMNPVVDQPKSVESEVGSSLKPSVEDPEMTLYNSKLHVLDACSLEELDSVFNRHHEEAVVPPAPDSTVDNSVTSKSEVGMSGLDIAGRDPERTETDSELLVLEANSVEVISSALKQLTEGGLDKPNFSELEPSEVLPARTHLEPLENNSDLQVVEAKSLDDIDLAFRQLSEGTVEKPLELMEHKDGLTDAEASKRHLEPEVVEVQSAETSERHLEPEYTKVQSAEEIELDLNEDVARESAVVVEQSVEIYDAVEAMADVSSSSASTSRKSKKKGKSGKSGSGSSSSSSSSSSDSE